MARIHVIIDDEILEEIDRVAGERGRGRFLEEAAREKLDRAKSERALRKTSGIAAGPAYEHWRDRRSTAAWVLEGRRGNR